MSAFPLAKSEGKSFKTLSGETLYMRWTTSDRELGKRAEAFREISQAGGNASINCEIVVRDFRMLLDKKGLFGIDVVDEAGKLRGMVLYTPPRDRQSHFTSIWCDEEIKHQGVASRLVSRAFGHARKLGADYAVTEIGVDNVRSLAFAKKGGWQPTGGIEVLSDVDYAIHHRPLRLRAAPLEENEYV